MLHLQRAGGPLPSACAAQTGNERAPANPPELAPPAQPGERHPEHLDRQHDRDDDDAAAAEACAGRIRVHPPHEIVSLAGRSGQAGSAIARTEVSQMVIKRPPGLRPSEITPEAVYRSRRDFLAGLAGTGLIAAAPELAAQTVIAASAVPERPRYKPNPRLSTTEKSNSFEEIAGYNNFYEFGTDKSDPARNARNFRTRPWSVTIEGEAEVTGTFNLEDILKPHPLEERIYRLRCVEAWSMVVPWIGFPLADLVKRFKPTSRSRYVEFTTLLDPKRMPGQRYPVLDWPYVEALRMDEAMHPLAILGVGLYGQALPNQNGAPLRLVVPWKYGFKSIKSIVRIRFTEQQPRTSWQKAAPREYGFYANVNPQVDHPRWSQKRERRIGADVFRDRQPTQMFNGYAGDVASLYAGMDLAKNF
jgi:sulfoxide reductase catalytic subunit YedY